MEVKKNGAQPIKHPTATTSLGSRTRQAGGDGSPSTSKGYKQVGDLETILEILKFASFWGVLQWTSERKTMVLSYSQIFSVLIGSNPDEVSILRDGIGYDW